MNDTLLSFLISASVLFVAVLVLCVGVFFKYPYDYLDYRPNISHQQSSVKNPPKIKPTKKKKKK